MANPTPVAAPTNDPFATNTAAAPKKAGLFGKKLNKTTIILIAVLGVLVIGGIALTIFLVTSNS
jgi:flagellar basal body-associated protein FliL